MLITIERRATLPLIRVMPRRLRRTPLPVYVHRAPVDLSLQSREGLVASPLRKETDAGKTPCNAALSGALSERPQSSPREKFIEESKGQLPTRQPWTDRVRALFVTREANRDRTGAETTRGEFSAASARFHVRCYGRRVPGTPRKGQWQCQRCRRYGNYRPPACPPTLGHRGAA